MSDKPAPVKNVLSSSKLTISAPNPAHRGVFASFGVDIYKGNPKFFTKTNSPNEKGDREKNYGKIIAAVDLPTAYAVVATIRQALLAKEEFKQKIECYNHSFAGGQRSQEITHESDIIVGRDSAGVIYISVVSKSADRDVIKFPFGPSDKRYHKAIAADGTPLDAVATSRIYAQAWVAMLDQLFATAAWETYEPPPAPQFGGNRGGGGGGGWNKNGGGQGGGGGWKNNQGGGGGGGWNNRPQQGGGGGGGAPKPAADDLSDDDIPF